MALNKQKGNMYDWITHTWNPIGGECPHQCSYCYMRGFPVGELRLRENFLRDNLADKMIFVGSSVDMWAEVVPDEWITEVLERCFEFPGVAFLFQTKNPARFSNFNFPAKTILGTTLETNRDYGISQAPDFHSRARAMTFSSIYAYSKMISIEPIMDFDLDEFVEWIRAIQPEFVSIGADSKGHNLPEPEGKKVEALIEALGKFTVVKEKANLRRLLPKRS